jgi:hypothetical protein
MAVHVAQSLLDHDGLDLPDIFARFQRWATSGPKDIGLQTKTVLTGGDPWNLAAGLHFQVHRHAAGSHRQGRSLRAGRRR